MATRNERRRAARARVMTSAHDSHGAKMMAFVVKADGESQQIRRTQDSFSDLYAADRAIQPPLPLLELAQLGEANALHAACISAKVADSVGRGWLLVPEDDTEGEGDDEGAGEGDDDEDAVERKLRDQLAELCKPSGMTFDQLTRQLVRDLEDTGWGVWEIGRENESDPTSDIASIYPMPGHTVRATKDDNVFVQVKGDKRTYFKRFGATVDGDPLFVSAAHGWTSADEGHENLAEDVDDIANEVIVVKHYSSTSPFYGRVTWLSAIPAIAEMTSIREYNVSWFNSGGQSDRLIHFTASDATVAEKLGTDTKAQLEAARGKGHTSIITYGTDDTTAEVHVMAAEEGKRDGQFQHRREELAKEILIAHQVPPYRIGWVNEGALGGTAAPETLRAYRDGTIEPLQELPEGVLAATLFNPEVGGIPITGYSFEFSDLDWEQEELDITRATVAVDSGMATPREGRKLLGMDEGDPEDSRLDELYYKGVQVGSANGTVQDGVGVLGSLRDAIHATLATQDAAVPSPEGDAGAVPEVD